MQWEFVAFAQAAKMMQADIGNRNVDAEEIVLDMGQDASVGAAHPFQSELVVGMNRPPVDGPTSVSTCQDSK